MPCLLNPIKLLTTPSRVDHVVFRALAHCGLLCWAKQLKILFSTSPMTLSPCYNLAQVNRGHVSVTIKPMSPALAGGFFTTEPPKKPALDCKQQRYLRMPLKEKEKLSLGIRCMRRIRRPQQMLSGNYRESIVQILSVNYKSLWNPFINIMAWLLHLMGEILSGTAAENSSSWKEAGPGTTG